MSNYDGWLESREEELEWYEIEAAKLGMEPDEFLALYNDRG